MASTRVEVDVQGHRLSLSNLDKVLYPAVGFTKGQVIDFYIRISPVLLPHLKDRPLTLKRYPDGVDGIFFYEKRCPPYRPKWVKTARVWSEANKEPIDFCMANDLPSIVWAANLGDLELHTFLSHAPNVDQPSMLVFDLDPGEPANVLHCAQVSFWLKDEFDELGLESFIKTSGSKGLQMYIPLNTAISYDTTKPFAHALAEKLERAHGDLVVSRMEKRLRKGKVFVDWSQNDEHKTTICVYSLRAREEPTASTPVTWEEVEECARKKKAKLLVFHCAQTLKRAEKMGDLFEPVETLKQKLPKKWKL